jgi:hypothetical protein
VRSLQRFLPGSNHWIGRGPKSALAHVREKACKAVESSLSELHSLFGSYIPQSLLEPADSGKDSRQRVFSFRSTFWAFLSQTLSPQTSCREVVRKVQSFCSHRDLSVPGSSDSAYCQARKRLSLPRLKQIHKQVSEQLTSRIQPGWLWHGHRVRVVDGTGIRLADTASNQAAFPQPAQQRPGCGFPVMQVVACMCLHTGAMIEWVSTKLYCHESPLMLRLLHVLEAGEVLLADRGFCSFFNFALCRQRAIEAVMRLHQMRRADLRFGKVLGREDRLVIWNRPKNNATLSDEQWSKLPEKMAVRIVRIRIERRGFRVQTLWVATTLSDPIAYPKEALAQLYRRRWQIELNLRDIKTSMGLEHLRCKSPQMVKKELCLFLIAYNLIRLLSVQSALLYNLQPEQISFKATADTLRQYRKALCTCLGKVRKSARVIDHMLQIISHAKVKDRPDRIEPRAIKLRPKNYQRMTQPRHLMLVSASRRNKGQKRPMTPLT